MERKPAYFMENEEETLRLDLKTDEGAVRRQALWCGLKPGMRVLDVGCGPGKTTAVLHELVQPGGSVVGLDFSPQRLSYAREHYGSRPGLEFQLGDLTSPPPELGKFDLIWVRFVLEYYRKESPAIVGKLINLLHPGGYLSLLDLDYNCLSHYELPVGVGELLSKLMARLDEEHNFDTFAGRKLYSYLYDAGLEEITMNLMPHHLIYGELKDADLFNWVKKVEVNAERLQDLFATYPGGYDSFFVDFRRSLQDPRRFTYTPLILCKGRRPLTG